MRAKRSRAVRLLSWLLLAGGVFFLASGAREFLLSVAGQKRISADWASFKGPESRKINAPPDLGGVVCRLLIPRLDAHLFVVEGTDQKDLRMGPGHMQGSALPGTRGNCIIAGHRDTHFRILKDVRKGDDIILQTRTGDFHYRVSRMKVVSPSNREPLQPTAGRVLSLITCYPFYYVGPAPERFVVRAELTGTLSPAVPEMQTREQRTVGAGKHRIRQPTLAAADRSAPQKTKAPQKRGSIFRRIAGRIFRHPRNSNRNAS